MVLAGIVAGWGGAAAVFHDWRGQVPEQARVLANPEAESPAGAGAKVYGERWSSGHGVDALGRGRRPSLRTDRVRGATDGELMWLLENGELRYGMPSWSGLPEEQRWQVIRFLRTLPEVPEVKGP